MKKLPIKQIIRIVEVCFSLTAGFIGAFLLFALIPLEGNYKLLVVQSGSMEPTVPLGSLVLVVPQIEYTPGDIVTFFPSEKEKNNLVTHRINSFDSDTFGFIYKTKGDANKSPDLATIGKEQILGKTVLTLPLIGFLTHQMQTPLGFIFVVIVPATVVVYEELKKVYQSVSNGIKHIWQKKQEKKLVLTQEDDSFLQDIAKLRYEHEIIIDSRVVLFLLFFGLSFVFVKMTNSFFSDTEIASASFVAGISDPIVSPTPAPVHIVINEVYYDVDSAHGFDSPGDRGVTVGGHVTQIRIVGKGAESQNSAFVDIETLCSVVQNNQTDVDINLDISSNTGNNSANGNTGFGEIIGNSNSNESGDVANIVVIDVQGGNNTLSGFCGGGGGRNHEWIEIYNPTT
ncbi:MAG: signal peptidase I, partial [Patescibacteria group bacterium]